MKRPTRRRKMAKGAASLTAAVAAAVVISASVVGAKKKEKVYLPEYVLKAKTVLVMILPDAGEPTDDPFANRGAQEEVEKAFMKWGRFQLTLDAELADLVIGVRKGIAIQPSTVAPWIRAPVRLRPQTTQCVWE